MCAYTVDNAAPDKKGALVAAQPGSAPTVVNGCVVSASDGTYSIVLPAGTPTGRDLLIEATGGTYCSNEAVFSGGACAGGGAPVAMGTNALRTVTSVGSTAVSAPLTLLTTAATQTAGNLTSGSFGGAYATIASSFGVSTDPATPTSNATLAGALTNLAGAVGTETGNLSAVVADIAAGTLTAATLYPAGTEFVVGTDQAQLRMFTASASGLKEVSTAALPGIPATYTRSGSTVTIAMPSHKLETGVKVALKFAAGTGGTATSGTYAVTKVDEDTVTITDAASGTIADGSVFRNPVTTLSGTYAVQSGSQNLTITSAAHGLTGADITFTLGGKEYSLAASVPDPNTFSVVLPSAATATASGPIEFRYGVNWTSFDVTMHPSGKWLYVASLYECWSGTPFCWGGDVISQYAINWRTGKLGFVRAVRTAVNQSTPAPVRMTFNPAGTLMAHQDDDLDGVRLWSVDTATGALTLQASSAGGTTSVHGLAFSRTGPYVYHGSSVFTVGTGPYSIAKTTAAADSNATDIVGDTLFAISPRSGLYAYSLANPTQPSQIATIGLTGTNRDATTRNGSVVLTSGFNGVKSYTFDGKAFAAAAAGELQRDGTAALGSGDTEMYRSVNLNSAGNLAVASYFRPPKSGEAVKGGPPSGYLLMTVGPTGALARVTDLSTASYARSAKFIKQP